MTNLAYRELFTSADVLDWFQELVKAGLNLHPDTPANDYVNHLTNEPAFSGYQAEVFNCTMDEAFIVCENEGVSVYELCSVAFKGALSNTPGHEKGG